MEVPGLTNEMKEHLTNHLTYPATKSDIVKACQNMSEFNNKEKEWFVKNLPEGNYKNAEDVMRIFG